MKKERKNERLLESIEYIDADIVDAVMAKIEPKRVQQSNQFARKNRWLKTAVALAACAVLLALAIPMAIGLIGDGEITSTSIVEHTAATPAADNTTAEVEAAPVYDGSRGLLYEVNEDGVSAAFIGYGTCTDETVYIASTYNGLPVTEMRNKQYSEATHIPAAPVFGSEYLKHLVISDTVKFVSIECIRRCPNIESIHYGASMDNIMYLPFDGMDGQNFSTVSVSPENPYYSDKGNCIVDLRTKTLVVGTPTSVIPDDGSVKIIGMKAFTSAKRNLTSLVIPEGVKVIEHGAFMVCDQLETLILPDSLEFIEMNAFDACTKLKKLEFGTNLKAVDQLLFHWKYVPEIHYKGTVEQWESVIKTSSANVRNNFEVICTDGVSYSDAGLKGWYNWYQLPEYADVWNQRYPDRIPPDYNTEYTGTVKE